MEVRNPGSVDAEFCVKGLALVVFSICSSMDAADFDFPPSAVWVGMAGDGKGDQSRCENGMLCSSIKFPEGSSVAWRSSFKCCSC